MQKANVNNNYSSGKTAMRSNACNKTQVEYEIWYYTHDRQETAIQQNDAKK